MSQIVTPIADIIEAFHARRPDPADPDQAVSFGTSGHRGRATAGCSGQVLLATEF